MLGWALSVVDKALRLALPMLSRIWLPSFSDERRVTYINKIHKIDHVSISALSRVVTSVTIEY